MKLNHSNLVVNNVAEAIHFFETYFKFKCVEIKGDNIIAILINEDDFTLVITKAKNGQATYPESFHIGFLQQNAEEVNQLYRQLKTAGMVDDHEPRKIRDSFGFYFNFENIMIEIGTYAD
ncbi:MAG: VOC family protein [Ginsengibacter sp.]